MKTKPYILSQRQDFCPHSNRLKKVTDAGNAQYGFKDGNTTGNDYAYNANGNLTKDLNKHITQITYNALNLPPQITVTGNQGGTIQFYYTATGQKVQKTVQSNTGTTTTNYDHGFIYKNGQLQFISQPEGYIKANDNGSFTYVFQYKDQLGNIRLSFKNTHNGTILNPDVAVVEERNYYPFGLEQKGYNETSNNEDYPYRYNGKELEDALSLDWYDYGARWYDPAVGRWLGVDPMTKKYPSLSPYSYTADNPIIYTDPSGAIIEWQPILNENGSISYLKEAGDKEATLKSQYGLSGRQAHKLYASMENGAISGQSAKKVTGSKILRLDLSSKQATDQRVIDQFVFAIKHSRSKNAIAWKASSYFSSVIQQTRSLHVYSGRLRLKNKNIKVALRMVWNATRGFLFSGNQKVYQSFFSNRLKTTIQTYGSIFGKFQDITHSVIGFGYVFPEGRVWQNPGGIMFTVKSQYAEKFNKFLFK